MCVLAVRDVVADPCLSLTRSEARRAMAPRPTGLVRILFVAASFFASALIGGISTAQAQGAQTAVPADQVAALGNTPGDIAANLEQSVVQPGAIFPNFVLGVLSDYEAFKQRLWQKRGLRFAHNYTQIAQYASDTLPIAPSSTSLGLWAAVDLLWAPIDRSGDFEGSLAATVAYRGPLNSNPVNAAFGVPSVGSLWSAYEWGDWDGIVIENLFWEQRFARNFRLRIGNQAPQALYNFSRFKDARTSFTASPFAFQETFPYPAIGFGIGARWQPSPLSGPYVVATLNDMNADPQNGLDWSKVGSEAQFFYGGEFGYRWREGAGGFSHVHVDVFYADERARNPDILPNEAGWGFRIYGEKQFDRVVVFGGDTYNTARGGGIGATFAKNTLTGGVAYLNPVNIRGELSVGVVWSQPFENTLGTAVPNFDARSQYGFETYWRAQLTPNISITPGVQVIANPSFNTAADLVVIPSFKFRLSL